jgi:DNA-binding LytR/AlgR family response regulator
MKILIIEDEPQAVERMESLLRQCAPEAVVLARLDTVKSAVAWIQTHDPADLILLDIQLADGLSFEIFGQTEVRSPIIFTTAFNEYALKAFKVNSIDYLLKPIAPEDLRAALAKYHHLIGTASSQKMMESIGYAMQMLTKKYKERFVIKVGEHLKTIEVKDVLCFYSQEKFTFAQTVDQRKHILDFTLDQLEGLVDPALYFRINRKYLVGLVAVQDMISYTNSRLRLTLRHSDDPEVIVARERVQEFRDWLDR